jgi:hypothetical protein
MRAFALVATLILFAALAACSEEKPADAVAPPANASLSEADVEQFLDVYPKYLRWAENREGPVTDAEVRDYLTRQGVDPSRFLRVVERIMLGYMAISLNDELPRLKRRIEAMEQTRREIMGDGNVAESQKQRIREEFDELIREQRRMMQQLGAFSQSERELLLKHESRVEDVLSDALNASEREGESG